MQKNLEFEKKLQLGVTDSIFGSEVPLLVGAFNCAVAALLCLWTTGDQFFLIMAILFGTVGIGRYLTLLRYRVVRQKDQVHEVMRYWRVVCIAGGTLSAVLLGIMCAYSILYTNDAFAKLASVAIAMANTVGITGRNFGSRNYVLLQTVAIGFPLILALFLDGVIQEALLGALFLTYMLAVVSMSTSLRKVLHSALRREADVTKIADEMGVALETMPNGLLMFDEHSNLKIGNEDAIDLLQLDKSVRQHSSTEIFEKVVSIFNPDECIIDEIKNALLREPAPGESHQFTLESQSGHTYRFYSKAGVDGNLVLRIDDITVQREADDKIVLMARYDTLSGLSNRGWFFEQAHRLEGNHPGCNAFLAVIDINHFKSINDTYGHPVGDEILRQFGQRIAKVALENSITGRFGGDEFVLLIPFDAENTAFTYDMAIDLKMALNGTYRHGELELDLTSSIGIAEAPLEDLNIDELIAKADYAQYSAKRSAETFLGVFEKSMHRDMQRELSLKTDLKHAIENDGLRVMYQPIFDAKTGEITDLEVLSRWKHEHFGHIRPDEFIPIAEETGLISEITRKQLKTACNFCTQVPDTIGVSVNLSAVDFRSNLLLRSISDAINGAGIAPHRLTVEVTETSLLDLKPSTLRIIDNIRALGVKVALDDFGVGYSSLSYLHRLPLDRLKIDKSFVEQVEDSPKSLKMLATIADLAKHIDAELVIEGIEKQTQRDLLLSEVKVDLFQGYLFSKPLPAEDVLNLIPNAVSKAEIRPPSLVTPDTMPEAKPVERRARTGTR